MKIFKILIGTFFRPHCMGNRFGELNIYVSKPNPDLAFSEIKCISRKIRFYILSGLHNLKNMLKSSKNEAQKIFSKSKISISPKWTLNIPEGFQTTLGCLSNF